MTSRALPAGLLCAALALAPALVGVGPRGALPSAAADASHWGSPIKIMLAGDSITQGFDGDYTWRYRLDQELRRQQVAFDFVGPYRYTYGGANSYRIRSGWDTDHDATGGTRLRFQLSQIRTDMAASDPDVLVALYGTTDLLPRAPGDGSTVPLDEELEDLRDYIQVAREVNANVDIVLGEVTTRRIPNRQEFNDALGDLVAEANESGTYPDSRVVVADLDYPEWNPNRSTYDQVHPTPAGEAIIAQRVSWALKGLGVLPESPKISGAGLIWNPPWAPSVRATKSRRIVVNFYTSWRLYRPQVTRIWIKDLRTRKTGISSWRYGTKWVSQPRRPGRYRIRMQGRRTAMLSPWSRAYTVRVRR